MPTLLLAFANNETNRLQTLTDEYNGVSDALRDREIKGDFMVVSKPMATRAQIQSEIRAREEDLYLFLYSGHAGPDRLQLEDGVGHSEGITALLGRCPILKVVILNGCSTAEQVNQLLKQEIPIVIATSAPVDDQLASQFSIALFRELSQHKLPITEAFDRAIGAAMVYGQLPRVDRGLRGLDTGETETPLWGIYYKPESETLVGSWHLPVKPAHTVDVSDRVNERLRRALIQIGKDNQIIPTDATLDRLPYMIHLPIRKLLAVETPESAPFYDTPSRERFKMLLYAYRSIINLTTYALLAETWERILQSPNEYNLSAECYKLIKEALFGEKQSEKQRSNLPLLEELGKMLKESPRSQFTTHLISLLKEFEEAEPRQALDDLEAKIKNQDYYQDYFSTSSDALAFCLETENSLAVVLIAFGFWVNYSLISVKDIGVLNHRRIEQPNYLHQLVALNYGMGSNSGSDKQYLSRTPLETASVILHHYDNWKSEGISLSPFVIDKNALIKAPKADLHYLLFFSSQQGDCFCYREAKSHDYDKFWEILPEKKKTSKYDVKKDYEEDEEIKAYVNYHSSLKNQLTAFAKTVLNKTTDEL